MSRPDVVSLALALEWLVAAPSLPPKARRVKFWWCRSTIRLSSRGGYGEVPAIEGELVSQEEPSYDEAILG